MNRKVFIYGLRDPRDGKIKYVGQTANMTARMAAHFSATPSTRSKKGRWAAELNREGLSAEPVVLEVCDEDSASERETFWIEEMSKRSDLLNFYAHKTKQKRRIDDGKSGLAMRVSPAERRLMFAAARICGTSMGEFSARCAVEVAKRLTDSDKKIFDLRFMPILFASQN